jgi:hypothetical protein
VGSKEGLDNVLELEVIDVEDEVGESEEEDAGDERD